MGRLHCNPREATWSSRLSKSLGEASAKAYVEMSGFSLEMGAGVGSLWLLSDP